MVVWQTTRPSAVLESFFLSEFEAGYVCFQINMVRVMVNYSSGRDQNFDLGLGGLISFSVSNSRPNVWA